MATSVPTSAAETAAAAAGSAESAGAADESTLPLPEAAVLIAQGAEAVSVRLYTPHVLRSSRRVTNVR